jgi:hypothetical protein
LESKNLPQKQEDSGNIEVDVVVVEASVHSVHENAVDHDMSDEEVVPEVEEEVVLEDVLLVVLVAHPLEQPHYQQVPQYALTQACPREVEPHLLAQGLRLLLEVVCVGVVAAAVRASYQIIMNTTTNT